jgi:hypothetical protein
VVVVKVRYYLGEDEEEDVRSYRMTLRKRQGTKKLKAEALDCTVWRNRVDEALILQ